jgi:uncharacterized cupredoxin-like copper-binding protein
MRMYRLLLGLLASALLVGGCGGGGSHDMTQTGNSSASPRPSAPVAGRSVDVEMRDIAYSPSTIAVHPGETVTFVFHNVGQAVHEAFLGDEAAQADHEKKMESAGMGGMERHGEDITVQPGRTGSLTHTFQPGQTLFIGCHEPGHYAAGMRVALAVS